MRHGARCARGSLSTRTRISTLFSSETRSRLSSTKAPSLSARSKTSSPWTQTARLANWAHSRRGPSSSKYREATKPELARLPYHKPAGSRRRSLRRFLYLIYAGLCWPGSCLAAFDLKTSPLVLSTRTKIQEPRRGESLQLVLRVSEMVLLPNGGSDSPSSRLAALAGLVFVPRTLFELKRDMGVNLSEVNFLRSSFNSWPNIACNGLAPATLVPFFFYRKK